MLAQREHERELKALYDYKKKHKNAIHKDYLSFDISESEVLNQIYADNKH